MSILTSIKQKVHRLLASANLDVRNAVERQLLLQAQLLASANRSKRHMDGLYIAEFCAFSQWGEDGIIGWLVGMLPEIPRTFVEFGVVDYLEANTRLLLQMQNWRGLVMDGSADNIQAINRQDISWRHDLTAKCAFIDSENINGLMTDAGFQGEIGLLSIDIDGNDYWVWKAINTLNPAIVVSEYNAVLGDLHELTVPYRADFDRSRAHYSNQYFGASIQALAALAKKKGYTFIGTTSTGCNAFFIRNDLAPTILSALDGVWAFPSAVREGRRADGNLSLASGVHRMEEIRDMPLVDLKSGALTKLSAIPEIYSPEWLRMSKRQL
jgi:hypothetical protein